jgi:hypothetical protein
MKMPVTGGPPADLAPGVKGLQHLAVDSTSVYWTSRNCTGSEGGTCSGGEIWKAPIAGGQPSLLASVPGAVTWIALDSTTVYWTESDQGVHAMGLDGGATTTLVPGPGGGGESCVISVAGTLYWTGGAGGVERITLFGMRLAPFPAGCSGGTLGITADATNLYWACVGSPYRGTIMEAPLNGGSVLTLASGQSAYEGVAVDAARVYWTNGTAEGTVMSVPIGGGTPTKLAKGIQPWSIVVDSTSIYWTDTAAGTVMKLAKP